MFTYKRKIVAGLFDASLLAANISQLQAVLESGIENPYYKPLLLITSSTIVCHIVFGILMIFILIKENRNDRQDCENGKRKVCPCENCVFVEKYNNVGIFLVYIIMVLNIAIAGLGLPKHGADQCFV